MNHKVHLTFPLEKVNTSIMCMCVNCRIYSAFVIEIYKNNEFNFSIINRL
jgi:hypothetical protein